MTPLQFFTVALLLSLSCHYGYNKGKNEVYETVIHKDKTINCYLGTIANPVKLP